MYRGRDLFAPGPVAMSATADAEAGVASALSRLAGATHRALSQRIAKATAAGFERIIHAYLVAAGYRDIDWVKRIGGISYATTVAPGLDRLLLGAARRLHALGRVRIVDPELVPRRPECGRVHGLYNDDRRRAALPAQTGAGR